mgnify:CR=1 FL=1
MKQLFDKDYFEKKYVKPEDRTPVDTLVLIGNGFDIWQGLDTRYSDFKAYYEKHLEDILSEVNAPKYYRNESDGSKRLYSDVEVFYSDPNNPTLLPYEFWNNVEKSIGLVDDQAINAYFGTDRIKDISICANNADRIIQSAFADWISTIDIGEGKADYTFGDNILLVNFNYTDTLIKRFGVKEVNEFHIHGSADDRDSIVFGHSTHPELAYKMINMPGHPRYQGLYHIEEFLYNSDKHVDDNYMRLRIFCALHGICIDNIKYIFVLGLGFGDADLGYIKHLISSTQGVNWKTDGDLTEEEKNYIDSIESDGWDMLNIHYAAHHRERVLKTKSMSFPDEEALEAYMDSISDNPYHLLDTDDRIRLEAAVVNRRYREEQSERESKIKREYLRMLKKRMHLGYLTDKEAFLEYDGDHTGAKWFISYYSDDDKKRIESVMKSFGCADYTLYDSIDECIKEFRGGAA